MSTSVSKIPTQRIYDHFVFVCVVLLYLFPDNVPPEKENLKGCIAQSEETEQVFKNKNQKEEKEFRDTQELSRAFGTRGFGEIMSPTSPRRISNAPLTNHMPYLRQSYPESLDGMHYMSIRVSKPEAFLV